MVTNFKNNALDQHKRNEYLKVEIFFECCALLNQAQYSDQLNYFTYHRRKRYSFITKIKNQCVYTNSKRSVLSRFKTSRHSFSYNILKGSMPGFYRAVW